jgi:transcriptional regulator with XRE-family HTH domain
MADWLIEARTKLGITKTALAIKVDVDKSAIGKYERGERRPSIDTAKKIADALGFDWTRFFDESQPTQDTG